ncbi:MAG: hypothetical protein J2O46_07260 [Nocardioides sp.]|nr:hypothetical protein [Nocardioides sp.]
MSQESSERVRVTGPPRRRTPVPRAEADEDASTRIGDIFLVSLMRAQLALALRILLVLVIGLGGLPLLFWLFPGLAGVGVLGIPLPWLLLGILIYPFLLALGAWFVRRAERNEGNFAELLSRREGVLDTDREETGR